MIRLIEVTYDFQTARNGNTASGANAHRERAEIPQTPPRRMKKHVAKMLSRVTLANRNTAIPGQKRVKKKNVEITGSIGFIEGA